MLFIPVDDVGCICWNNKQYTKISLLFSRLSCFTWPIIVTKVSALFAIFGRKDPWFVCHAPSNWPSSIRNPKKPWHQHPHINIKPTRINLDWQQLHFKLCWKIRRYPLIEHHFLQQCHQHNLSVAFATIARFRVISFKRVATFSGKDDGHALLLRAFGGSVILIVDQE